MLYFIYTRYKFDMLLNILSVTWHFGENQSIELFLCCIFDYFAIKQNYDKVILHIFCNSYLSTIRFLHLKFE